ncbi:MAG: hypothetical protein OFPI_34100 [Osedax symbiont Rs2]|nr:MAG: hypothetical protein OFPI_34100 [Osedax symbiont Rs2]
MAKIGHGGAYQNFTSGGKISLFKVKGIINVCSTLSQGCVFA